MHVPVRRCASMRAASSVSTSNVHSAGSTLVRPRRCRNAATAGAVTTPATSSTVPSDHANAPIDTIGVVINASRARRRTAARGWPIHRAVRHPEPSASGYLREAGAEPSRWPFTVVPYSDIGVSW